jgi:hypothetical protein
MTCLARSEINPGGPMVTVEPIVTPVEPIGPVGPIVARVPNLSGKLTGVTVKLNPSGKSFKVRGRLTLENTGLKVAKKVTAAVYLSPETTLSTTARPLITLDIADFFAGDGKIKPGDKVSIELKKNVPKLLAATLSGQYIIIVLSGSNVPSDLSKPIVFGPLPKVP